MIAAAQKNEGPESCGLAGDRLTSFLLGAGEVPEAIRLVAETFSLDPGALGQWFEHRIEQNPHQGSLAGMGAGIRDDSENRLVAVRFMFAQPWWLEGRETVVAFAAHTCMRPGYRGRGLGDALVRKSAQCGSICGSTSSGVSTQPIYARQGYSAVGAGNDFFRARVSWRGSLEKRLGRIVGRSLGSAADLLAGGRGSAGAGAAGSFRLLQGCDEQFDRLWGEARTGYPSCLARTSGYLNWRLFEHRTCPLRLGAFYGSDGLLRAYGVWHLQRFDARISQAVLRDFFCAREDRPAAQALLVALFRHWRETGVSWASLEVAHPQVSALFRERGFQPAPSVGSRYHVLLPGSCAPETVAGWLRSGLDGDYADLSSPDLF